MIDTWTILALLSSLLFAVCLYSNQILQMPSSLVMIYRGIVMFLSLSLFIPFFTMPSNPMFWLFGCIQGAFVAYSDRKSFWCAQKYGGQILSSIKPYTISFIFVLWLLFDKETLNEFFKEPLQMTLILACLIGVIYASTTIRQTKIAKEAFIAMLPALLVSALIAINNKNMAVLGAENGVLSMAFYYTWIVSLFSGLPNLYSFLHHNNWRIIITPHHIVGGLFIMLSNFLATACKTVAMLKTPNPAYVTAIISLQPVWILIWNSFYFRLKKVKQFPRCNLKAVTVLLISVLILILVQ